MIIIWVYTQGLVGVWFSNISRSFDSVLKKTILVCESYKISFIVSLTSLEGIYKYIISAYAGPSWPWPFFIVRTRVYSSSDRLTYFIVTIYNISSSHWMTPLYVKIKTVKILKCYVTLALWQFAFIDR